MLIMVRELGETIVVGDDITLTVLDVVGDQVKIAVHTDASLTVCEEEAHKRHIQDQRVLNDK